jgi:hypothetical protein
LVDEALDAWSNREDELLHSIIESDAIHSRHLDFKFDLFREMLDVTTQARELALLESIRQDALGNWALED